MLDPGRILVNEEPSPIKPGPGMPNHRTEVRIATLADVRDTLGAL